jgi:hypothetical protein
VRFQWIDGFLIGVEADETAKVDHVNFIKGILSALQVYSPVPNDGENIVSTQKRTMTRNKTNFYLKVREEDVLGVCTTRYKYSQKSDSIQVTKNKDLATCSKDKLHFSSSPVLTSLLGPLVSVIKR